MNLQDDYAALSPDTILDAVESQGFEVNAQILGLNSYENRVYQIGLEEGGPLIAKFYRPGRWSDEQIIEEHAFTALLAEREIPVVAPIKNQKNETLFFFAGYRFSLFERVGGYSPEPGDLDQLFRLGTLLGRIHQSSNQESFVSRDSISVSRNFHEPVNFLLDNNFIPDDFCNLYRSITKTLESKIEKQTNNFNDCNIIKCHGDWHLGNILWLDDSGGKIVDFDDCVNGPAIQDIWMMLSGEREDQCLQLSEILEGYRQFQHFDLKEVSLIESMRTLRLVYYSAWLAKRWQDPAFPLNFPWFNTRAYWQQHIRELEEQIELIDAEPLKVY